MIAKLVFVAGVLGVGGYVAHEKSSFDPAVFPYPVDEVHGMLAQRRSIVRPS